MHRGEGKDDSIEIWGPCYSLHSLRSIVSGQIHAYQVRQKPSTRGKENSKISFEPIFNVTIANKSIVPVTIQETGKCPCLKKPRQQSS